jgi:V/A-type H+-transporting ATPase subunit D
MNVADRAPTRAAVLELREEQRVVAEAYEFLDEKRLLLAAELLRQLERYEILLDEIEALGRSARQQLVAAVQRHGLQELSVYPATPLAGVGIDLQRRNVMGVTLLDARLVIPAAGGHTPPVASQPSPEAEQCRAAFAGLLPKLTALAGVAGNLYRLLAEYRRTERRARALENVVLPEIDQALARVAGYLEEVDLEDAIRVRLKARR